MLQNSMQCNDAFAIVKRFILQVPTPYKSQWRQWKQWNAIDKQHIIRFKNLDQVFSQNLDQKYGNRIINLDVFAYGMISSCMDIVYKLAYVLNAWCRSHYVIVMFVLKLCCRINWRRKLQHIVRHINKKLVKFRNGSTSCWNLYCFREKGT